MKTLYMDDAYLKEFTARVTNVTDGNFIELDQTAFYPNSGGQPCDLGTMICGEKTFSVVSVGKFDGAIRHEVDLPGLAQGDTVHCVIDWPRRYQLMKSHTASHVMSAVMHNDYGAKITGNQLSLEKIRIDFSIDDFDREIIDRVVEKSNQIIAMDLPTSVSYMAREDALKRPELVKLAGALPPQVEELRIVTIGDPSQPVDVQADGGTHVNNTSEIGRLELIKAENKGKSNRRVYVTLV